MPVSNGLAAAKILKKLVPRVPIILFTQHGSTSDSLFVSDLSIDRVVSKENAKDLIGHIRSLTTV
jgi:DNA-binding NarL/FixJ family response regulator